MRYIKADKNQTKIRTKITKMRWKGYFLKAQCDRKATKKAILK